MMPMRLDPRAWPLTLKVPLAVAALMVLVGVVLSERVMARLAETQERHLGDLAQGYLDGLSSSLAPSILRDDSWEVFDALERAQALNKGLHPIEAVVTAADGRVIAASDPRKHPIGTAMPTPDMAPEGRDFGFDPGGETASAVRVLSYPGRAVGVIRTTFDTRHLAAERRQVLATLAATNGVLTLLLAAGGWVLVSVMMRPVRVLSRHLGQVGDAAPTPIPDAVVARTRGEFGNLFRRHNALVRSMVEREDLSRRLAEEERLASLGRLASAVAHEINNPLGGMLNALATLKTHGHLAHVRAGSIGLIDRGLVGIRDVVRTTLTLYRADDAARLLTSGDFSDLRLLVAAEARRRAVTVSISNCACAEIPLPSTPVRQAVLNLLLNAVTAAPPGSAVRLDVECAADGLLIAVADAGAGMPDLAVRILTEPAQVSPLAGGCGLGLWTTRRLVDDLGGEAMVERPAGGGTIVVIRFPLRQREDLADVA
jgi:signal transduction histidine kinase